MPIPQVAQGLQLAHGLAIDARIRELLLDGIGTRQIAASLAPEVGRARREIYSRVLELREES